MGSFSQEMRRPDFSRVSRIATYEKRSMLVHSMPHDIVDRTFNRVVRQYILVLRVTSDYPPTPGPTHGGFLVFQCRAGTNGSPFRRRGEETKNGMQKELGVGK